MEERLEKLQLLLEQEGADRIFADTLEETQANLHARGVEFSAGELKEIVRSLAAQTAEGELNEDALEDVSGGAVARKALIRLLKRIAEINGPIRLPKW